MSANVLLNLLNELRKRDKIWGLLIIYSLFFFATSFTLVIFLEGGGVILIENVLKRMILHIWENPDNL